MRLEVEVLRERVDEVGVAHRRRASTSSPPARSTIGGTSVSSRWRSALQRDRIVPATDGVASGSIVATPVGARLVFVR